MLYETISTAKLCSKIALDNEYTIHIRTSRIQRGGYFVQSFSFFRREGRLREGAEKQGIASTGILLSVKVVPNYGPN